MYRLSDTNNVYKGIYGRPKLRGNYVIRNGQLEFYIKLNKSLIARIDDIVLVKKDVGMYKLIIMHKDKNNELSVVHKNYVILNKNYYERFLKDLLDMVGTEKFVDGSKFHVHIIPFLFFVYMLIIAMIGFIWYV